MELSQNRVDVIPRTMLRMTLPEQGAWARLPLRSPGPPHSVILSSVPMILSLPRAVMTDPDSAASPSCLTAQFTVPPRAEHS